MSHQFYTSLNSPVCKMRKLAFPHFLISFIFPFYFLTFIFIFKLKKKFRERKREREDWLPLACTLRRIERNCHLLLYGKKLQPIEPHQPGLYFLTFISYTITFTSSRFMVFEICSVAVIALKVTYSLPKLINS